MKKRVTKEDFIKIGQLTADFSMIARMPRYPDGHRETDVEHSFHLSLSAIELASTYYPHLDVGLVAQFGLVHDFPEIYAGDVPTFDISDEDRAKKEANEKIATKRLLRELPSKLAELLERYEDQKEPEARFVKLVDKLLPETINIVAGESRSMMQDYGVVDDVALGVVHGAKHEMLRKKFPEFSEVHELLEEISGQLIAEIKNTASGSLVDTKGVK